MRMQDLWHSILRRFQDFKNERSGLADLTACVAVTDNLRFVLRHRVSMSRLAAQLLDRAAALFLAPKVLGTSNLPLKQFWWR
jgi:hypothetical protein